MLYLLLYAPEICNLASPEFTVLSLEMRSSQGLPLNDELFHPFVPLFLCLNLPVGSVDTAQSFAAFSSLLLQR